MPDYRSYGNLDDRIDKTGDRGFLGFNNRLRSDQIPAGTLSDAQNVRMDRNGEAQIRKGIDLISNPLTSGASALTLPFPLVGADINAGSFVVGKEYTIKTVGNTSFTSVGAASNTVGVVFTATGAGSGTGVATVAEIVVTATSDSGTLDITSSNAFTDFPSSGTVNISDASGITADPNGNRAFTKVSASEIQISDQNYNSGSDSSVTLKFGILNDEAVNAVYGSTTFSDPAADASQYIIIATNAKAVAVKVSDGTTTDIAYPSTLTISQPVDMIQAFNKVFIFRDGETALENNLRISTISSAAVTGSSNTATITTSTNHNLVTGDIVTINNLGFSTTDPNRSAKSITKTGDTTFTYSLTASGDETYTVTSTSIVATDFTKVASGTYTQPVNLAATGFTITNGLATVTVSNTLSTGDTVNLITAGGSTLTKGTAFTVSEASSSEFKFFVNTDDVSNQTDVHFIKKVSVGLGFSHMPAPPFASYHQRRLVMPYKNSVNASADSYTAKGILDEIIASDLLDSDTYDQVFGKFRLNAGTADFVVGLHSFSNDTLLVFNRNSIHEIRDMDDLETAKVRLLTDEVGCLARKSIVQVGNNVIFLSDNGVYGLNFLDEYNLRGTETPLSEPVNETIKRINKAHQDKAVAVYFDNRYYLAIPLDDSTQNNALLIYNFLNQQWESLDTVTNPDGDVDQLFHYSNLLISGAQDNRGVYAVNDIGGIHEIDSNDRLDGVDRIITQIGGSERVLGVKGSVTTRQYTLNTLDRKRWKDFDLHIQSADSVSSEADITVITENPDFNEKLTDIRTLYGSSIPPGEDVSIRGRIGSRRGYGIQLKFNNTTGRPRFQSLEVNGAPAFRSINTAD